MTWVFELVVIISVFLVIYWILFGQRKQKELLSQAPYQETEDDKKKN